MMRRKSGPQESAPEKLVRDIRRATRKHRSAEEKIRIVLEGLRGEYSIAELCRREGIVESLYYSWSKEFLEAGKRRLAGDTTREATSGQVKDLRGELAALKEAVADLTLENRLLKKRMARPVASSLPICPAVVCYNVSGLGACPGPRWRYARPNPHKHRGVWRRFFNQVFGSPFDCQAISFPPLANVGPTSAPFRSAAS